MLGLKILALVVLAYYIGKWLLRTALRFAMRRIAMSPEVKARMAHYTDSREREEGTREDADWFGTTGLDDATERELPRYLRREFGELMDDDGALQARDLRYLGRYDEADGPTHYWRIPGRDDKPLYAYVILMLGTTCTGWSGREPPDRAPDGAPQARAVDA